MEEKIYSKIFLIIMKKEKLRAKTLYHTTSIFNYIVFIHTKKNGDEKLVDLKI